MVPDTIPPADEALAPISAQFHGQAEMAEEIAAIWGDLDIENLVFRERVSRSARRGGRRGENEKAVAVFGQVEFVGLQSMPCDSTPRSLLTLIFSSLGSTAPGNASGTLSPTL